MLFFKSSQINQFLIFLTTYKTAGYAIGGISMACLNPAVATGADGVHMINKMSLSSIKHIWIYWVGPGAGGIFAAVVFRVTNAKEFKTRRKADEHVDHSYKLTHGVK